MFTLRASPPSHPKTADFATHTVGRSSPFSLLPPCTSSLWEEWEEDETEEEGEEAAGGEMGSLGALLGLFGGDHINTVQI